MPGSICEDEAVPDRRNQNHPPRTPREAFERAWAAEEARHQRAMLAHQRAMAAMQRQLTAAMAAHERAMSMMQLAEAFGARPPRKPPNPRKRRPDDGLEPALVKPRPNPKPLGGGAAAPIERGARRKTISKAIGETTARTRVPTDGRSSQIL